MTDRAAARDGAGEPSPEPEPGRTPPGGGGTPPSVRLDRRASDRSGDEPIAGAKPRSRRARRRADVAQALLARAGQVLADPLDPESTLAALAELALPVLGQWCLAYLVDEDAVPRLVRLATLAPERRPALEAVARCLANPAELERRTHPLARALRSGEVQLVADVPDDHAERTLHEPASRSAMRALAPRTLLGVPLVARGRVVGAVVLGSDEPARRYGAADVELARELAARAALAVDNARLLRDAEAASRAKSDFLAMMSHELRTPLNAIAGYVELIRLGVHGPVTEAQDEALTRVQRNQAHLLALINQVLSYAQLEGGRAAYTRSAVPLDAVLRDAGGRVAEALHARAIAYAYRGCPPDVHVRADAELLRQILGHLLSNAAKFTAPGGQVVLACELGTRTVAVRVRDTGRGIPPEKLASVFEPFVQVDRTLRHPEEGVGLGLAISRDLARGMGAALTAESALGDGSTFTLTLARA